MDQMLLCSSLFPHPQLLIYSKNVQIICKLSGVNKVYKYQNIGTTAVELVYSTALLFVELFVFFSPRLIEFSVHGTISSYVVFQNIVIIPVLTVDLFSPSQLLSVHVCV